MSRPDNLRQAIEVLWPELPGLVGEDWPQFEVRLRAYLAEIDAHPERAPDIRIAILDLFAEYDRAVERLGDVREQLAGAPEAGAKSIRNLEPVKRAPNMITRYTDITAPKRLPVGQRGVVTVGLAQAPVADSSATLALKVQAGTLDVSLHAFTGDLAIIGEAVKQLQVEPERDTAPVVFYVKGISLGAKTLRLDFRQAGTVIGSTRLVIEVVAESGAVEMAPHVSAPVSASLDQSGVVPHDLDLRIMVEARDGGLRLGYILHSPSGAAGYYYQRLPDNVVPNFASPQAYQERLRKTVENLRSGRDVDGAPLSPSLVADKLAGLGRILYDELFTPELKAAYRQFRDKVHTLLIASDEPWIPWELIRPYDSSDLDHIIDDDFLGLRYEMTRWLAGSNGPAGLIEVEKLACVAAGAVAGLAPLPATETECAHLRGLAAAHGVADYSPDPVRLEAVLRLLNEGRIDLWHVAAHGKLDIAEPDEAVVALPGGMLRAVDVNGPRQANISRERPLIFLNACQVGGQGWALMRLGGWVEALVLRSRCGAFVGPQWSVSDGMAMSFAQLFYAALAGGATLGMAAQAARRQLCQEDPADPTWLAYSVYAHPNARVVWAK